MLVTYSTDSPFCMHHGIGVKLFDLITNNKECPDKLYLDWNNPYEKYCCSTIPVKIDKTKLDCKLYKNSKTIHNRYRNKYGGYINVPIYCHQPCGEPYTIYYDYPSDRCIPLITQKNAEKSGYKLVSNNIVVCKNNIDKNICYVYTGILKWDTSMKQLIETYSSETDSKNDKIIMHKLIKIYSHDGNVFLGDFLVITIDSNKKEVIDSWCQSGFIDMMNYIYKQGPFPKTSTVPK